MKIDHPRGVIIELAIEKGLPSQKAQELADQIVKAYAEINAPRPAPSWTPAAPVAEFVPGQVDWL